MFSITDNLGSGGIGGLIGFLIGGTIEKSFSTGNVSSPAKSAGGFIGGIEKGNIRKSFSTGNVSARSIVGGFAGYLVERDGSGQALIEDCYSIGNVTGGGGDYKNGGFIGALEGGKVKNSYSYSYFLNPIDKSNRKPAASFVGLLMHEKTNDDTAVIGSYALDYGQNTFIVNGDKNDQSK